MWDISAWKDIEANVSTQVNSCFAAAAGGERHVQFRGMSRVSSSSLGDDSSSPLLFLTLPDFFDFLFFFYNSLKGVGPNTFWRLFRLFSQNDRAPQCTGKGLRESWTLAVKRLFIVVYVLTPDCGSFDLTILLPTWSLIINPNPNPNPSLCLSLYSVLGQVQAQRVQHAGPVLPRPVPGRLLRAGQRQQLRVLQELAARQQLRGEVSSWILRVQGLAVCQLFLLPGGWSLRGWRVTGQRRPDRDPSGRLSQYQPGISTYVYSLLFI